MVKSILWSEYPSALPRGRAARRFAAVVLRTASAMLARMARSLAQSEAAAGRRPVELEFYAESGAPEGALYADGRLIGYVPEVSRL